MSIVSLWIVNSFPRRRLLFIGITGQIVGFAIAAAALLAPATVSTAYGWVMVRYFLTTAPVTSLHQL